MPAQHLDMARYATWRKHREQRARAVQQAIFMPAKRGSRAAARGVRYARISESYMHVCLHAADRRARKNDSPRGQSTD